MYALKGEGVIPHPFLNTCGHQMVLCHLGDFQKLLHLHFSFPFSWKYYNTISCSQKSREIQSIDCLIQSLMACKTSLSLSHKTFNIIKLSPRKDCISLLAFLSSKLFFMCVLVPCCVTEIPEEICDSSELFLL